MALGFVVWSNILPCKVQSNCWSNDGWGVSRVVCVLCCVLKFEEVFYMWNSTEHSFIWTANWPSATVCLSCVSVSYLQKEIHFLNGLTSWYRCLLTCSVWTPPCLKSLLLLARIAQRRSMYGRTGSQVYKVCVGVNGLKENSILSLMKLATCYIMNALCARFSCSFQII